MSEKPALPRGPAALTAGFLALMGTVFLLYTGPDGYAAIKQAKLSAYFVLAGGYLVLMALYGLTALARGRATLPTPAALWRKSSPAQKLVLCYWGFTALSALCSPFGAQTILGMTRGEGLVTQTLYCGTFLCVSAFAPPIRRLGGVTGAVMTAFCLLCLVQMQGYNPLGLYPDGLSYLDANINYAGIYLGTIGNADLVSALLCLTLPLFAGLALRGTGRLRWLYLLPAALCALVLVQMDVQAGLVGAGLGLLLAAPKLLPLSQKGRKIAVFAVILLLLAGFAALLLVDAQSGTVYELQQVLRGNWQEDFGSGRVRIWRQVLALVPQRPWLGFGPDTMSACGVTGYFWYHAASDTTIPLMVDAAHNEYLNILFHQGIPALLCYVGALLSTAAGWLRSRDGSAAALGAGVLCYGIQAFFGFSMCHTAGLFWLVWAALERINILKREDNIL